MKDTLTLLRDAYAILDDALNPDNDYDTLYYAIDKALPSMQELVRRAGEVDDFGENQAVKAAFAHFWDAWYGKYRGRATVDQVAEIIESCLDVQSISPHLAPVASGWMPIKSAPRDGRKLCLWTPEYGGQPFIDWLTFDGDTGKTLDARPTHWMPLPACPK